MLSLQELEARRKIVNAYLQSESKFAAGDKRAQTSEFWQDMFSHRDNVFLSLNDLLVFLRSDDHYGIASDVQGSVEGEQRYYKNELKMVQQCTPDDFIRSIQEPTFGSPTVFDHEGICHSATFVMNIGTLWRSKQFIEKYLSKKDSLSVMEIGAGYGGVSFQLQSIMPKVSSYTICDLPENLYLSSLYLQHAFPDKKTTFITNEDNKKKIKSVAKDSLTFTVPQNMDALECKFDFFINTFSFQEMDAASVHGYIDFIRGHLADDGICYLINTHNKVGIKNASDYGYQDFNILHLAMFRNSPATYFNTIPCEVVLGHSSTKTKEYNSLFLDALCEMMQLGINSDLQELCDQFLGGNVSAENGLFLGDVSRVFTAPDLKSKLEAANSIPASSKKQELIKLYLRAVVHFISESDREATALFQECLTNGLSGFAKTRLIVNLLFLKRKNSSLNKEEEKTYLNQIAENSPNLVDEMTEFLKDVNHLPFHRRDFAARLHLKYEIPLTNKIVRKVKSFSRKD